MTEGTRPDMGRYRRLSVPADATQDRAMVSEMVQKAKAAGATYCRVTLVDGDNKPAVPVEQATGVWVEGWKQRPDKEGPFDPQRKHTKEEALKDVPASR